MKQTRVVFFGTPQLAVPMLEGLMRETTVVGCVTQTDKPVGRTQRLVPSPVKTLALQHGIPVLQPKTLKREKAAGEECYNAFVALQPDIAVVIAYGKIIPADYLAVPQYGFVNVHPSLLPVLRGPSPLQYALLQGINPTGVSIMLLDAGMDTGPVLAQQPLPVAPNETAETLHDRVQVVGTDLLLRTLRGYLAGTIQPTPQDNARATYSHIITKTDGLIDWNETDAAIERRIRAFTPWPGVYTFCNGKRLKILAGHCEGDGDHARLIIDRVQPEGKKPMAYADFLRGYPGCTIDRLRADFFGGVKA